MVVAIRKIVVYPENEKGLRTVSGEVKKVSHRTRKLITDLKDTVLANPGLGLAAPQLGVHERVFVVRFGEQGDGRGDLSEPFAFINPEILDTGPLVREYDGCLSIPRLMGYTHRPQSLTVRALDESGNQFEETFYDFDARVIHHEMDHLNGILYIDRIKDKHNDLFAVVSDDGENYLVPYDTFIRPEFFFSLTGRVRRRVKPEDYIL